MEETQATYELIGAVLAVDHDQPSTRCGHLGEHEGQRVTAQSGPPEPLVESPASVL